MMVAPVQVLVSVPQVFAAQTAVLRQHTPAAPPVTTGPGFGLTQTAFAVLQVQVRLLPSPAGKLALSPFEQA